ncbi:hypothetical protein LTR36_003306 [Oleoguttula mirabilis]|uniref:amidase n=1 Tax=Oleoguttula mirabilis TaxID=1507867 RepID=A0AAV9JYB4_9PEZI|nr:hypothetical protein LTR36_003306 [Oleoguttula mirabilis]
MHEEMDSTLQTNSWQIRTQRYRDAAAAKIPEAWRLHKKFTEDVGPASQRSVLDIPYKCGILTERELDITENYDVVALLEQLAEGAMSSEEVTTAFCKRAAIAQQLTNCLTETFFDQALERAKECDAYLAKEKKTIGPLHGLPISLKDSFNVKGIPSSIGFVSFLDHPVAEDDGALPQILLALGTVLYVKTNIPQSLMTADSDNNVFGRCLNPNKLLLTAGGSSGGEGALLAMKGSPIGVGTDIAGSIRIPSYVNGTYGLKPTCRRIPYAGQKGPARPGGFGVMPCAGPLARSVRDIEYFMRAVLSFDVWTVDEAVIAVPWRQQKLPAAIGESKKLTLGFILEDPKYPVHPPVLRTLKTALAKLEAAGHTVIDLAPHLPPDIIVDATENAFTNFAMDPAKTSLAHIARSGEPIVPSIPTALLPETKHFQPSVDDVFRLNVERAKICSIFRKLYVEQKLDAIVLPIYQATAVAHDHYGIPVYTTLANVLDHPAMSLPYLKADKSLDAEYRRDVSYIPAYVPDEVEGAPCGIQLMGRPMRDEELVVNAQVVVDALQK